ncbi:hypothetical protein OROHE_023116 [Orobanche hederae]
MTLGPRRRIAFCSPRRSNEWTLLSGGEDGAYRNLAYSRKHNRLLCVCEDEVEGPSRSWGGSITLEGWDVDGNQPPIRDWAIRHSDYEWPLLKDLKRECFQMKYLVECGEAEAEEELWFVVVRHVNLEAGPKGSVEEKIWLSKYRGCHYIRTPYKTIGLEVFKIDSERGELVEMKDNSLGGLAMFVGINHSFALPAAGLGLRRDSVYFTDENRVVEPTRFERTNYGGHDNGIFDYQTKGFHSCCDLYPVEFERIRKILPLPLWFTPTPATIMKGQYSEGRESVYEILIDEKFAMKINPSTIYGAPDR